MADKQKIGVVGLGIMGAGMANNLVKGGFEVFVWNRTTAKAEELAKIGATVCRSPAEVCKNSDVIFEVTANDESSEQVWSGKEGILSSADSSKILIASATLSVGWIDKLAGICKNSGYIFLDMPLTGGRIGAETGNLTMLVGGNEAKLELLKSVLDAIAGKVYRFGEAGHGTRYKLLLNTLQAIHMTGYGEVMKIAEKEGMDIKAVGDALVDRPGGAATEIANSFFHNQPDPITFSVKWITKDLQYAKKFKGDLPTPLLEDALQAFEAALNDGRGDKDWTNVNE